MVTAFLGLLLIASKANEPVFGGAAEIVGGLRPHPEQVLGLYMRRSKITAYFPKGARQSAHDPWIRVGETRTTVSEARLDGVSCLCLESKASRDILGNNPSEGQNDVRVKRRIVRVRKVWIGDEGSVLKTRYEQLEPDGFVVDMLFQNGTLAVTKIQDEKTQRGEVEISVQPEKFENEFLAMYSHGKIKREMKEYATLDSFSGGLSLWSAKVIRTFEGLIGEDRYKGVQVELSQGTYLDTAWVSETGELLQLDLGTGERLMVEPKTGEAGLFRVKTGGS